MSSTEREPKLAFLGYVTSVVEEQGIRQDKTGNRGSEAICPEARTVRFEDTYPTYSIFEKYVRFIVVYFSIHKQQ